MLLAMGLALLVAPPPEQAGDGNALLAMCGEFDPGAAHFSTNSVGCLHYVLGVADAANYYESHLEIMKPLEQMQHVAILAKMGALPDWEIDRLSQLAKDESHPLSKMAVSILKDQAQAVAAGRTQRRAFPDGIPPTIVARLYCAPKEVTVGQLVLVIVKFLRDHPERLHQGRAALTMEALTTAFPCPKE